MQHLEVSGAVRHIYVIRRLKVKNPSLLVCDQFKAHVTESTKRLATKLKTHFAVIPG